MAATFGTPIAAVVLAVELLLFELKPRSLVPVSVACAVAALLRGVFAASPALSLGLDPLFPVTLHGLPSVTTLVSSVLVGVLAGLLALALTLAVYAAEDAFQHVPDSLDVVAGLGWTGSRDWRLLPTSRTGSRL